MKRLIYITYLSLLALILISCEKEAVAPDQALAATQQDDARSGNCISHFYLTKTGIFHLGNIRTDVLLVGFADNVSLAQKQQILSQFTAFNQIDSDFSSDSGIITTIVKLHSNTTCQQVESMLQSLERRRQVVYVGRVFNDPNMILDWIGVTNEMLVTIKSDAYYPHLQQLTRLTRTSIVTNLFDQLYIVSADKKSAGNVLQMSSLFNASPFVEIAEPNFLMQMRPIRSGKPTLKMSKDMIQTQAAL